MDVKLEPLDQQVIVITGASSGIGLASARAAAGNDNAARAKEAQQSNVRDPGRARGR